MKAGLVRIGKQTPTTKFLSPNPSSLNPQMDPNYLQGLHSLLLQTTSNDTAILRAATAQLNREYYQNPVCISGLANILSSSPEESVRQLAAVELRKRVTSLWIQLPVEERDQIKAKLPEVILVEQHNLVRHSIARVIAVIASIEVPQNTWPALLPFLQQSCTSQQVVHREVGSYILFTVLESIVTGFQEHLSGLFDLFRGLLVDPESSEVRITTVRALGVIAQYLDVDDKNEVKSYQALLPSMIQVIGQAVEAGNEAGARHLFDVLETLLILEVPILSKHIPELTNFLLQCGSNRGFHDELRILSLGALNWTVEYKKSKIQSKNLAPSILEGLMPITTEDEPVDADDDTPSRSALRIIDGLATKLPPSQVFPALHALIVQYFASPEPANRRGAILALGICVEGCSEYMNPLMNDIWPFVEAGLIDSNAAVRRATCTTVGCLCQWLEDFCASKHAVLLPNIMNLINDPDTQRVACTALDAVLEILHDNIEQYLQLIMDRLSNLLENAPLSVKAVVTGAIGSAAHASKRGFLPYFLPTINRIAQFLTLTGEGEEIELRGISMDTIGTFAEAVGKDVFRPYFPEMMKHAFSGMEMGSARLRECSFIFFGVMASVFGEEFALYLPQVVPALLTSCRQLERGEDEYEVAIADATSPTNGLAVGDVIDLDESVDDGMMEVNSAIAIEKEIAADTIGTLFASTQIHFLAFVEPCTLELIKLLSHYYEGIRKSAIDSLLEIVRTFYDISDHEDWVCGSNTIPPLNNQVQELIKHALGPLLEMYETEDNKSVSASLCSGLAETISKVGPGFLAYNLDAICNIAVQILEQKAPCQQDPGQDDDEEEFEDQAEYDSILISSAGDLVTALSSALGSNFSQGFNTFFPLISKYYTKNRTETDRSAAIGCIAGIIDNMKDAISPHTQPLLELIYLALSDSESTVLSDAAFALGLVVENSQVDLSQQYPQLLRVLRPIFVVTADSSAVKLNAKDNAAGAVGRLIVRNTAAIPLDQVLPVFIDALPLKNDYLENRPVFRALFHLFRTNGPALYPYMDRLLSVFTFVLDSPGEEQITEGIRTELVHLLALINQEVPEKVQAAGLGKYILPGA